MSLSPQRQTEICKQACEDQQSGNFTEYKGSALVDVIFAPLDLITGTSSTREVAAEEQSYYNKARTGL